MSKSINIAILFNQLDSIDYSKRHAYDQIEILKKTHKNIKRALNLQYDILSIPVISEDPRYETVRYHIHFLNVHHPEKIKGMHFDYVLNGDGVDKMVVGYIQNHGAKVLLSFFEIFDLIEEKATEFEKEIKDMPLKSNALGDFYHNCWKSSKRPEIKKVIYSGPCTIVLWSDGDKTIVRCKNEEFDKEKGLAMVVTKKFMGTNASKSNYNNIFKKWARD